MTFMLRPLRVILRTGAFRQFHVTALVFARKTVQNFKLADIGEGITECEIIKWNVKPNASVQAFDPLCEVQSDKASVEITSPFDGVVKELLVQEGGLAKVGEGLCLIETEQEEDEPVTRDVSTAQHETPPSATASDSQSADTLVNDPDPPPQTTPPQQQPPEKRNPHPLDPTNSATKIQTTGLDILATPSVRHFAKQRGVNLADVAPGTGRGGRIQRTDIEACLSSASDRLEESTPPQILSAKEITVGLSRTRLAMWKAMTKSLQIPHFGYSTYLDVTPLQELLPQLNAHIPSRFLPEFDPRIQDAQAVSPTAILTGQQALDSEVSSSDPLQQYIRMTLLPLLLKTLSKAMEEWPVFRSSITSSDHDDKPSLTIRPQADISIALSTPTGLYSPTIQGVNTMTPYEIMGQLRRLQSLGRQSPNTGLGPKDMPKRGGTVTVSNVGAIGQGEFAHPVLVPGGGVAIVALGRAKWVNEIDVTENETTTGAQVVGTRRLKMGVSWSADHRVVEGAELAAFMECWRSWVEQPARMIGAGR